MSNSFSHLTTGSQFKDGSKQLRRQDDFYELPEEKKIEDLFSFWDEINFSCTLEETIAGVVTAYSLKDAFLTEQSRRAVGGARIPVTTATRAIYLKEKYSKGGGAASGPETDPVYLAQKGQPNGAATLDASGTVPASQLEIVFQDPVYGSVATTDKTGRVDSVANWGYLTNKTTLTDTDIFYIADFANNINHTMTPQAVANYISSKLSTLTRIPGGAVNGGSTVAASTVVAAQPATAKDGDYLVVQTAGYVTVNGGTPKKLGIGDKLVWNATDAEYIIIPAGENQTATDVPVTPVLPSATTVGFAGTSTQQALEQLAQEIKKKYYTITQTWEVNSFKSGVFPTFGSSLPKSERKQIIVAHDPTATVVEVSKTVLRIINPISIGCKLIINEVDAAGALVATHDTITIPASATSQVLTSNATYPINNMSYLQFETDCFDTNVGAELVIITTEL